MTERAELERIARQKMVEACAAWIDQWDWTAGSIVTGYVVIMETTRPDGEVDCTWATGSGADVSDLDDAPLVSWRVEGLARKVIRDIYSNNVMRGSSEDE